MTEAADAVAAHVESFFADHPVTRSRPSLDGPVYRRVPEFEVLTIGPGPRLPRLWTFVSLGCWDSTHDEHDHGNEFMLVGQTNDERHLLTVAMTAYYHAGPPEQRLDLGHTVPIGEGWQPGSQADHLLVSTPYPFGPDLEWCRWTGGHAHLLWLLPITSSERAFKAEHGLEALEQRFDDAAINFWDSARAPVA